MNEHILTAVNERMIIVSKQYNALYHDQEGHSFGTPEWYNHHDYASGAWKAKHDALSQEFDFLCKLIDTIENERAA